ncbi:disintegrin and metalloproteinase domain-containing protein 33 [Rana temporaria]|uniref:disintegrin and metalloproteinase domain-containing protein 33 n=1 Tax=Rana temporaria TaxID=8407 RepID=UPI001AAD63C7|nr:disintegrin and metalloproteinase domain-containing protein 33 [Rana temporaria]
MRNLLCAAIFILLQQQLFMSEAIPPTWSREISDDGDERPGAADAQKALYEDQAEYTVRIQDRDHILKLTKARDLLPLDFTASYYRGEGELVTESPRHLAHCCYTGTVEGVAESSASLCTCHGLSGYITIRDDTYVLDHHPSSGSLSPVATMLRKRTPPPDSHDRQTRSLYFTATKGQRENYNIELFLVADKKEFQRHGEDLERTRQHLISVAHHLGQIFSKIGFQVFLVGVEIWTQENRAFISETAHSTLQHFLRWRMEELLPRKHHDNVQLISGAHFRNHALGEAFLGKMCTRGQSGGIIKDTGLSARELAKYVAHEMGHNLGMSHDTENCYCPAAKGKCLLSRRTGCNMNDLFSDCSHRFLNRFLEEKNVTCLKDRPQTYIDEPKLHTHSTGYSPLEAVGMVSVVLCPVVFLMLLVIICNMKLLPRRKVKIVRTNFPS